MKIILLLMTVTMTVHLSFGQYDVDIKKNENPYAEKKLKQQREKEQLGNCVFIPFHEYKEGMKFYFPRNEYKEKDDFGVLFYYYAKDAKKDEYRRTKILYKDIAGKMFVITKIEERKGIVFPDTYITLKQIDGNLEIEHKMQIRRESLKRDYEEKLYMGQSFVLPYVIYTADIDSFKIKFLNKDVFTKFLVKGRQFQKVTITQIGAGDDNKPVRVVFETMDGNKEQQDICTCGTNVPTTFADYYYFSNFFQLDNPKDKYKGSDEDWELICQSKIRIGMTEDNLKLSWGEPKKINETVVAGVASKQFIYAADQY